MVLKVMATVVREEVTMVRKEIIVMIVAVVEKETVVLSVVSLDTLFRTVASVEEAMVVDVLTMESGKSSFNGKSNRHSKID